MADTTKTIWRSAARFFSGTMLSRITGLMRDMAMAFAFGTESVVAALLVAFRFAHLLRRLLGEGAMQTALIPHFEALRLQDKQRANGFFRDLTFSLTIGLTLLILAIMGGIWGLLYFDRLNEGNAEIAWLTFLMMPSLLFICLFGINASLMQCEKSYFLPSAAPVVFNLCWIIGIACTFFLPSAKAMTILSLFIVAACFAQWVITLPQVHTYLRNEGTKKVWAGAKLFTSDVISLGKPLVLGILGVAAAQINNALDAVFARWADPEGPALLWYAIRLQQLPLALFGIAISGALLPPLSRAIKAKQTAEFKHFLDFALLRTLALMLPITACLFIVGDSCIALIYGHGHFSNGSIVGTTQCLWGYSAGLVPMALVLVLAPAFYAKGDYRTPSLAAVGSMLLNVALNTWMVAGLGLGAASVAWATSASAWLNFIWLAVALEGVSLMQLNWRQILLPTALTGFALFLTDHFLWGQSRALEILQGGIPSYGLSFAVQCSYLGLQGLLFLGVFTLAKGFKPFMTQAITEGRKV